MKFTHRPLFRWSEIPWFGVAIDYDPALVEQMKNVPVRAWDSQTKTWWYPSSLRATVEGIILPFVPDAERLGPLPGDRPRRGVAASRDDHSVLCVTPDAPDSVVAAAYEALKREARPEVTVGGDGDYSIRLERAWRAVCGDRGMDPDRPGRSIVARDVYAKNMDDALIGPWD